MKKVLFIMLSLYNGGAEKSLVNLLNELPEDKYEIDLLLFKPEGIFLNQVPPHVRILETPDALKRLFGPVLKSGKYMIPKVCSTMQARLAEKGSKRIRAYRWNHSYTRHIPQLEQLYDVAIGYASNEILYYLNEKVTASRKYVWVHNDYVAAGYSAEYDFPHYQNMDGIVTISDTCKEILEHVFPELSDRLHCIANITSSKVIRDRSEAFIPQEYSLSGFKILSIGRLGNQKGFDMAIEAAALLKKRGKKFNWFIIGGGELEHELTSLIQKENVEDCVHLIGVRENPYPYILHCDVLAQTSRFEGKSVVLDEAKILAVPILATNYPTVRDQILEGKEGVIVPMNAEGIAEGLEEMMDNTQKREVIRNYLMDHEYGNQDEVNKYMKLIDGEMIS